jgi:hypothetical protein
MGLLKTLFFILIFFYGFKFLAKLFAPFLLKKAAETIKKKAEQQFSGQQKQQQEQEESSIKEGETVIDTKPASKTESKKSMGDYVDFEEID